MGIVTRQVFSRVAPVRFGYGLGVERLERFRFSALVVPLGTGVIFSIFQHRSTRGTVPVRLLKNGSYCSALSFVFF